MDIDILVISLARSLDRRQRVLKSMQARPFSWSFLDAVDGALWRSDPPEYDATKVWRLLGFEMTRNEIGCFASHKKAWQRCVESQKTTLIFEDDFVLLPHFESALDALFKASETSAASAASAQSTDLAHSTDWQLLRLQALVEVPHTTIRPIDAFTLVRNSADPLGATAYLLRPSAAQILLAHAQQIYEPVDHFLEHHEKHGLHCLALKPYPVGIVGGPSTITDRPNDRKPITGWPKIQRSWFRAWDRLTSKDPWFPR